MPSTNPISERRSQSSVFNRILYFFPFQLLILHLKRNHVLLIFWLLLFLYITNTIGKNFGIVALFLAPEYNGGISVYSFAILGFSLGGFIMAFHIYSYIMYSSEFLFLATLARPFLKFSLNNMLIPIVFILTLLYKTYVFLKYEQLMESSDVFLNIFALLAGALIFYLISVLYFIRFNKNVYAISGKTEDYFEELKSQKLRESQFMKRQNVSKKIKTKRNWRVETYMSGVFKISLARNIDHYERNLLDKVFAQNHINASVFEISLVITFIGLGLFREYEIFNIPAGASILLLFTLFTLIFSALYSWMRGWTLTFVIAALLGLNYLSNNFELFRFHNYAYGLDYEHKAGYTYDDIKKLSSDEKSYQYSVDHTIKILNNWKKKNVSAGDSILPKMVFVNISGGGLRAALWSMVVLDHMDSISNNKFFKQTQLMTGASGGMIGGAYFRELYLRKAKGNEINMSSMRYKNNISKDLLNPLAFGIATSDMLIRFQSFYDGKNSYKKDRGWFFENKLVKNLNSFYDKRLKDYFNPEYNSLIPMMIFSPSIVNDGRRMLISAQPISYLTYFDSVKYTSTYNSIENVEYNALFKNNNSKNVKMTSVLRMNATFPYILPMVYMPTEPSIEIMDAGIRDNYGLKTSVKFIKQFRNWISKNTGGVVILQIRDKQKYFEVDNPNSGSLSSILFSPFATVINNLLKVHDYVNDDLVNSINDWFNGEVDVVTLYMDQPIDEEISMSWHLTPKDKIRIYNSLTSKDNVKSIEKIKDIFKDQ